MTKPESLHFISRLATSSHSNPPLLAAIEVEADRLVAWQSHMDRAARLRKDIPGFMRYEVMDTSPILYDAPEDWWWNYDAPSHPQNDLYDAIERISFDTDKAVLYGKPIPSSLQRDRSSSGELVVQGDCIWWATYEGNGAEASTRVVDAYQILEALLVVGPEEKRLESLRALIAAHPKKAAKVLRSGVEIVGTEPVAVSLDGLQREDLSSMLESDDAATRQAAIVTLGTLLPPAEVETPEATCRETIR